MGNKTKINLDGLTEICSKEAVLIDGGFWYELGHAVGLSLKETLELVTFFGRE
jgi:hypothetical protein